MFTSIRLFHTNLNMFFIQEPTKKRRESTLEHLIDTEHIL